MDLHLSNSRRQRGKLSSARTPKHSGLFYDCALVVTFSYKLPGVDLGLFPIKKVDSIGILKDILNFSFFLSYGMGVKQHLAVFFFSVFFLRLKIQGTFFFSWGGRLGNLVFSPSRFHTPPPPTLTTMP